MRIIFVVILGLLAAWWFANRMRASDDQGGSSSSAPPVPPQPTVDPEPDPEPPTAPELTPEPPVRPKPSAPKAGSPKAESAKPKIAEAVGEPDDLTRIKGVGPKLQELCYSLGVKRFDQIAGWSAADIAEVDQYLKIKGRIARDRWVDQAKLLAAGDDAAYKAEFG